MLDPTEDENAVLSAIPYTANSVVLHTDTSLLPKRKAAWASWNYLLNNNTDKAAVVTYQIDILQGIESKPQFCVTADHLEGINKDKILREFIYHHPVFNKESIAAQQKKALIDGHKTAISAVLLVQWFFHEDGVRSAVNVAKQLGLSLNSAIYIGDVRHRRFAVKEHHFKYPLYMMWVDLAKPEELNNIHPWLSVMALNY